MSFGTNFRLIFSKLLNLLYQHPAGVELAPQITKQCEHGVNRDGHHINKQILQPFHAQDTVKDAAWLPF